MLITNANEVTKGKWQPGTNGKLMALEIKFLFQKLSISWQRGNAVLLLDRDASLCAIVVLVVLFTASPINSYAYA